MIPETFAANPRNRIGPLTDRVIFRCPELVGLTLVVASEQAGVTPSEYIRRAVVERLRTDGFPFEASEENAA